MKSRLDPPSPRPRHPHLGATHPAILLRVALWSVLIAIASYTRTDPDLWGHVRFGLDLFRDRSIPSVDPYSFTSDRGWVNHEWGAEAIMAGAFLFAGNPGLVLLKVAVVLACCCLVHATLRHDGVGTVFSRDVIAALAIVTTAEQAHHVRPQLFSLLCFAVLLWSLTWTARAQNYCWLFALPPLFAVWANCHGGWIVGGAVMALFIVGLALRGALRPAAWCTVAGVTSLVATLATPYGLELWRFLGGTVGFGRADIREWQPVYVLDPHIWFLWLITFALAVLGLLNARQTSIRPERMLVVVALAVMSLQVSRLLAIFALATLFFYGDTIAQGLKRRRATSSDRQIPLRAAVAVAIGVIMIAVSTAVVNGTAVRIDRRHVPEPSAVEFLKSRPGTARVLVWFDWGQYAIWHLPPHMQVSIDGRRETVYSAALQERHLRFYFDLPGGATLPRELDANYVWLPKSLPAARRLSTHGDWHLVYEGEQSAVFERGGGDYRLRTIQTAFVSTRPFPGP
jgi:hypothetical protein